MLTEDMGMLKFSVLIFEQFVDTVTPAYFVVCSAPMLFLQKCIYSSKFESPVTKIFF